MPQFTHDWFARNIPSWERLLKWVGWNPDEQKLVVEVGSFEGRSALWIMENLIHHPDSRLHCIDTFQGSIENPQDLKDGLFERFARNVGESPQRNKIIVHRKYSATGLIDLLKSGHRADFIYIDGSHTAPDVLTDCVLAFRLLKPGGLMICDDYTWQMEPPGMEDVLNTPKIAIDAFVNINRRKLRIPDQPIHQFAFVKTRD
jgi:predicted O-methyltransferase YrrM